MSHGHDDSEPCGMSCPVGGADGRVRVYLDNDGCSHRDNNVCPACAELTDAEAAAIREYFALLDVRRTARAVAKKATEASFRLEGRGLEPTPTTKEQQ